MKILVVIRVYEIPPKDASAKTKASKGHYEKILGIIEIAQIIALAQIFSRIPAIPLLHIHE